MPESRAYVAARCADPRRKQRENKKCRVREEKDRLITVKHAVSIVFENEVVHNRHLLNGNRRHAIHLVAPVPVVLFCEQPVVRELD